VITNRRVSPVCEYAKVLVESNGGPGKSLMISSLLFLQVFGLVHLFSPASTAQTHGIYIHKQSAKGRRGDVG